MATEFHKDNHYVPRHYLKRWTSEGSIWTYRTLVPHERVPHWKAMPTKSLAYIQHLYTQLGAEGENLDDLEQCFDREYEAPAEEALYRATTGGRLVPQDWERIARFAAVQYLRTPARYLREQLRWSTELPAILDQTMAKVEKRAAQAALPPGGEERQEPLGIEAKVPMHDFPTRITLEPMPNGMVGIKAEILAGRRLWISAIRHHLSNNMRFILQHRFTILAAPPGMTWPTSDDPVILLNYNPKSYDFRGGWGNKGTEILMPIGPKHLLYAQVGNRHPLRRNEVAPLAPMLKRFIAEHAHRMIFSASVDDDIAAFRPRVVDPVLVREEAIQLKEWHRDQSAAERKFSAKESVEGGK